MKATMDSVGRIVVPKALRDELGLQAGSEVDISRYGAGLHVVVGGRVATVVDEDGRPVLSGQGSFGDDLVNRLLDTGRR